MHKCSLSRICTIYKINIYIYKIYLSRTTKTIYAPEKYTYISSFNQLEFIDEKIDYSLAIYGKPNAGKSTLLNNILGFKRSETGIKAGTTSDIVEDNYVFKSKKFKILDTAGIAKKSIIKKKTINYFAILNSIKNIKNVDLVILLIDSTEGFDRQSKRIFNLMINKSSSILFIFNKIDLINKKKDFYSDIKYQLENDIANTKNISFAFISAKNINDINKIKNLIYAKTKKINLNIKTSKINEWLYKVTAEKPHPLINGKVVNFKYATQIKNDPITIKIFSNFSSPIKDNYRSYLINQFIKNFKIKDKQIKLIFSNSINPYN